MSFVLDLLKKKKMFGNEPMPDYSDRKRTKTEEEEAYYYSEDVMAYYRGSMLWGGM